ncbi:MAG: hypothetical protein ACI85U_003420 [Candidatus Promineifilaceae bacterium]|jgi:hypothetical protein
MKKKNPLAGFGLIVLGMVFLVSQYVNVDGFLVLPALGIGFIGWSILSRNKGLMIPGGIMSGIALGSILAESTLATRLEGDAGGALFMLSFAAGWFVITILTFLFFNDFQWWPLIPGGIMALIGVGILSDGVLLDVLGQVGRFWPIILIAIGLSIVWKQFAKPDQSDVDYEKSPSDLI